jgi:CelD/BcsL family acetyltransferase involved in cellulose biosynthesis
MSSTSAAIRYERDATARSDEVRADAVVEPDVAAGPCRYELITTREAFDALAPEWNDLFARAGRGAQAFQTFNWNWHWCNHYLRDGHERGRSLAIVTGRRAGRLVMVWPLVTARVVGLVQIAWMGEPVSQYGDVLVENSSDTVALLRAAWAYIIASFKPDLVRLPHVRDDAAIAPLIAELGAFATQRRTAPYISRVEADNAPPPSRNHRRALAKRLAKLGTVTFGEFAESAQARVLAVDTIEWKRAQLKQRGIISPTFADPHLVAFFADAAGDSAMPTGCRVLALECDGAPVAAGIFIACKDHIASHIAAFDARFEKASVGMLLLERAIAETFAEGFGTFDLLPPAAPYKARLAHAEIGVTDWAVPTSLKGAAYARLYLGFARPAMKAALSALPAPLRRVVARVIAT